jgi:nucleoside-diphosphate-sugar epimerase
MASGKEDRVNVFTVFVAGGSGTIGVPLVRALVTAGHRVAATTRTPAKAPMLRDLGATPVVVDALDAAAVERAVRAAAPTHVIHQLTALPREGPRRASDLEPTNRLRDEGTRYLLRAAIAAGATRIIAGSFAPIAVMPAGSTGDPALDRGIQATRSMESQILDAARSGSIEGIVLRYGLFYGPGNPLTDSLIAMVRRRRFPKVRGDRGQLPYIHIDDAVSATIAALDRGASGSVYDVADDHPASFSEMVAEVAALTGAPRPFTVPAWLPRLVAPYMSRMLMMQLPLSNAKARRELEWTPRYPSYREGLRQTIARAA